MSKIYGIPVATPINPEKFKGGSSGVSSWNDLTDKPFGEEIGNVLLQAETERSFTYESDIGAFIAIEPQATFTIENGKEYVIVCDGDEFVRTAAPTPMLENLPAVGNELIFGGADDGCPVAVVYNTSANYLYYISLTETSKKIAVYVRSTVTKQIEAKYLPMDAIDARIDAKLAEIPDVSEVGM